MTNEGQTLAPTQAYVPAVPMPMGESTALVGAEAREKATVFIAAELARRNPRDEQRSLEQIARSCKIPLFADKAQYRFPRGWKKDERGKFLLDANNQRIRNYIVGPSVQLARAIAQAWGNVRCGVEIVSSLGHRVRIVGWAWDLNTNYYQAVPDEFALEQQRFNEETGTTEWVEADERDAREVLNRRAALAERNAILKVVPAYVVAQAVEVCNATLKADAAERLKNDRVSIIGKLRESWAKRDVTVAMLERWLGHKLDAVSADELTELRQIWTAIEDGESKVSDHFTRDDAPQEEPKKAEGVGAVFTDVKQPEPSANPEPQPKPEKKK